MNDIVMENEDDALTTLPEGIRTHILSLLPTKDSVRTSVLSKKWENIWKYVNELYFDEKLRYNHMGRRVHFIDFVYHVLMNTECKLLNAFYISCSKNLHERHVETWVTTAMKREVKYLTMNYENENMVLPTCLLTCKSFVKLEINGAMTLKVPPIIQFPNLTELNLTRLKCRNEAISSKEELVLNVPALRVLHVYSCMWYHVTTIKIYSNALAEFMVSWCYYNCQCCGTKDCRIEIFGSSKFITKGYMLEDVFISRPESVVDAEFGQNFNYTIQANLDLIRKSSMRAATILSTFSNLTSLKLSTDIIEATTWEAPPISYPLLDKVKRLLVYTGFQKITWCGSLMKLLKSLPKLDRLQFNVHVDYWNDVNQNGMFELPNCISSSIEVLRFEHFGASVSELRLVKVFLENGLVLKQVCIVTSLSNKVLVENAWSSVQRASNDVSFMCDFVKDRRRKRRA